MSSANLTLRAAIEADVLGGAVVLAWLVWSPAAAIPFGATVVLHYAVSRHRITWPLAG